MDLACGILDGVYVQMGSKLEQLVEDWIRAEYWLCREWMLPKHLWGGTTGRFIAAEDALRKHLTGHASLTGAAETLGCKTPEGAAKRVRPKAKKKPVRNRELFTGGFFNE